MLEKAREKTDDPSIPYIQISIEDIDFEESEFDVVISLLAFHYIKSFGEVVKKVSHFLVPGGTFLFQ